jgi:hypothetical protein
MQLKLFNEALQQQIEESEQVRNQFLESTRLMISDLKRANQHLIEDNRKLKRHAEAAVRSSLTRTEVARIGEIETINDGSNLRRSTNEPRSSNKLMRTEGSRDKDSPKREAKFSVPRDIN